MQSIKRCLKCLLEKTLEQFPLQRKKKDGRGSWCCDCKRADALARYYANREEFKDRSRSWRKKQKEKHSAPPPPEQ